MSIIKFLSTAFICFCFTCAFSQKVMVDKVVAVVGDNIILQSDIEAPYQEAVNNSTTHSVPPDERCLIFDNLLLDKLFLAQAIIDSVTVSPEEIESELDRRIKYFISLFHSKEGLEEYYGKPIVEIKDDFKEDIEKQLISDKMRNKAFTGLKVSPAEVKAYFESIPKDSIPFFNAELELGELVMFPKVTQEEKDFALKKIQKIRKDILEGADFSTQAMVYSEDPGSYHDGGSLGVVQRGELVPEFEAVAYKLKEGELSDIVETPFGYHLILVDEKRGEKLKVRHILIRPKITAADLKDVGQRMDSILHQIRVDSLKWSDAVKTFSDDEQSKSVGGLMTNPKTGTQFFEKPDVEGTLIATLDNMKVGQYSEPLPYSTLDKTGETKQGFRIVYLKSESKPHQASLETDYSKIQAAAKGEKQQRALEAWINLHKGNAYIRIDDSMKSCPQTKKWLTSN